MKGNTPAFFSFLCLTGLRHDEASQCKWRDILLDEETPCLWSDPKWAKNAKRQRVVLNEEIQAVLKWHRTLVRCGPDDQVFPVVPNRHTWMAIREACGVVAEDQQGKGFTFHSCRKWFATELDRAGATPGVVSRLLRHSDTLAQARYIDPDPKEEVVAVQRLPLIWPEAHQNILRNFLKISCIGLQKPNNGTVKPTDHNASDTLTPGSGAGGSASQTTPAASTGGQVVVQSVVSDAMHGNGHNGAGNASRASSLGIGAGEGSNPSGRDGSARLCNGSTAPLSFHDGTDCGREPGLKRSHPVPGSGTQHHDGECNARSVSFSVPGACHRMVANHRMTTADAPYSEIRRNGVVVTSDLTHRSGASETLAPSFSTSMVGWGITDVTGTGKSGSEATIASSHPARVTTGGMDSIARPQDADPLAVELPLTGGIDDLAHDLRVASQLKSERIRKMVCTTIAAMLMGAAIIPPYQTLECDGKCCYYQAGCDTYQLVSERLKCCEESCDGATFLGCVDEAIGRNEAEAIKTLMRAADMIENWNPVVQATGQYADAIDFFKRCASCNVDRVRAVAEVRATDSKLLTALLPHNEQGNI